MNFRGLSCRLFIDRFHCHIHTIARERDNVELFHAMFVARGTEGKMASGVARRLAFYRRVPGVSVDRNTCTTLVEMSDDGARIVVRLACVERFSVTLDVEPVRMLISALRHHEACAIPATHDVYGPRLLCARPHDLPGEPAWTARPVDAPPYRGPMELALSLPDAPNSDAEICVVYWRENLAALVAVLEEGCDHAQPGG
jgi:hypothetical protein